ncbi:UNKNOWN [Stylonychia lemnae]|uniref:Uncharacterized protein n=1 Tax=Stylonychia lemnae TaxID=5949 RepID=A0A078ALW5_STYLE|nr:UNKNOWN [Stylonychia lemnae]|eukprot:CDW83360.1 UNKNOWN [Stylonychia lemnae]
MSPQNFDPHFTQNIQQPNGHQIQSQQQYMNYLNSFYNEQDLAKQQQPFQGQQQLQTQQSNVTVASKKNQKFLDNAKSLSISTQNYSTINQKEKISKQQVYNQKMQTQPIVSLKKSGAAANLNEKYQAYLVEPSRQIISNLGYQTQQIMPLSSYSSQSVHNNQGSKVESFRIIGINQKHQSPHHSNKKVVKSVKNSHKQRKSISKENQSNGSSRGTSHIIQDSIKNSQNNTSAKNINKHKSRVVKSSIKNQNTLQQEQAQAFYSANLSDINNSSPNQNTFPDSVSQRYEQMTVEDQLRNKMTKIQQNYQSLPQNSKSQRMNGKSSMRNNSQLKLKTLNPTQYSNFDSFEVLNGNLQSNFALTTKNSNTNHIFSVSHTQHRSPQKDSFQFNNTNHIVRNGTHIQDLTNDYNDSINNNHGRNSHANKIQQKIHKIIQATSQSTQQHFFGNQNNQQSTLQNSYSSGNLARQAQSQHLVNGTSKIFRPQSLKQLMPTIDEQIMKLTEVNGAVSPSNQNDQLSGQFLFKTQSESTKNSQSRASQVKIPLHPTSQSQFRGQIIKTLSQNNSNRNLQITFNHKESIEGGQLTIEENDKLHMKSARGNLSPDKCDNGIPNILQKQLQEIMMRTQLTLKASKKRELALQVKCQEQEEEIKILKHKVQNYEQTQTSTSSTQQINI